ncbi:MAG: L,D-transpeptidase family protein, partial [Rhizobiaceae bacterium]|nr:L,D-transpeptidase family protein [Rhizobiaceae bacterium]
MLINVRRKPFGPVHSGLLSYADKCIPCSLGRSGVKTTKREGDGATPAGSFQILYGYRRSDRGQTLFSQLPMFPINEDDGWCDDANHPNYNQPVKLPVPNSHEKMMRNDRLYDVCLVLDYNIDPCAKNLGSAIFFHLTREDHGPTEGC